MTQRQRSEFVAADLELKAALRSYAEAAAAIHLLPDWHALIQDASADSAQPPHVHAGTPFPAQQASSAPASLAMCSFSGGDIPAMRRLAAADARAAGHRDHSFGGHPHPACTASSANLVTTPPLRAQQQRIECVPVRGAHTAAFNASGGAASGSTNRLGTEPEEDKRCAHCGISTEGIKSYRSVLGQPCGRICKQCYNRVYLGHIKAEREALRDN